MMFKFRLGGCLPAGQAGGLQNRSLRRSFVASGAAESFWFLFAEKCGAFMKSKQNNERL